MRVSELIEELTKCGSNSNVYLLINKETPDEDVVMVDEVSRYRNDIVLICNDLE